MSTTVLPVSREGLSSRKGFARARDYISLVKSLQTGLLLVTAAAGYVSGCCLNLAAGSMAALLGSLFLAVGGSTVLNMVFDRDIDARMGRTAARPLPAGRISAGTGLALGLLLTCAGLAWSLALHPLYALVVFAGAFLDVVVYTLLLKRRTAYSILVGGISGGMPILAGRVLATGQIDSIGLLLALGVLLWIPTHILTFSIRYQDDYARAQVPVFPAIHGVRAARRFIAISTVLSASSLYVAGQMVGLAPPHQGGLGLSGILLCLLALAALFFPRPVFNFSLYKGASIYMLAAMLLLIAGGI